MIHLCTKLSDHRTSVTFAISSLASRVGIDTGRRFGLACAVVSGSVGGVRIVRPAVRSRLVDALMSDQAVLQGEGPVTCLALIRSFSFRNRRTQLGKHKLEPESLSASRKVRVRKYVNPSFSWDQPRTKYVTMVLQRAPVCMLACVLFPIVSPDTALIIQSLSLIPPTEKIKGQPDCAR